MSASPELANIAAQILAMQGALRVELPILCRRKGERVSDIDAAIASKQLCIYVLPPLPTEALQGVSFVFFKKSELRIRIVEQVKLNSLQADAYDLIDDVATALHWQPLSGIDKAVKAAMLANSCDEATAEALVTADPVFAPLFELGKILSHPLQICARPVEQVEDPNTRVIDLIFEATYELPK